MLTHEQTKYSQQGFSNFVSALDAILRANGSYLTVKVSDKNRAIKKRISFKEFLITQLKFTFLEINWLWYRNNFFGFLKNYKQVKSIFGTRLVEFKNFLKNYPTFEYQALRFQNIRLSMVYLFESFLDSGSEFAIIFEDDADFLDYKKQANLVHETLRMLSKIPKGENNIFMNISESYSPTELGIEHLMRVYLDTDEYLKDSGSKIYSLTKPAANTTAAIICDQKFVERILIFYKKLSLNLGTGYKFMPLDWTINRFMIETFKYEKILCFTVYPGLIPQLSLKSRRQKT